MNAQQAQDKADEASRALKNATPENRKRLEEERAEAAHEEAIAKMFEQLQKVGKQ